MLEKQQIIDATEAENVHTLEVLNCDSDQITINSVENLVPFPLNGIVEISENESFISDAWEDMDFIVKVQKGSSLVVSMSAECQYNDETDIQDTSALDSLNKEARFVFDAINSSEPGTVFTRGIILEKGFMNLKDRSQDAHEQALSLALSTLIGAGYIEKIVRGKFIIAGSEPKVEPPKLDKPIEVKESSNKQVSRNKLKPPTDFFDFELSSNPKVKIRQLERRWRTIGIGFHDGNTLKGAKADSNNALKSYLNGIGQHPLLTKNGEVFLFNLKNNTDDEIVEKWAREKILESNYRFVVSVAKRYPPVGNLNISDYISEGNKGLDHAINKFEIERGFKFSTYAMSWIRQYISRYIDNNAYDLKSSVHKVSIARRLHRLLDEAELTENSPLKDIAEVLCVNEATAEQILTIRKFGNAIRLDRPLSDDGETTIGDISTNIKDQNDINDILDLVDNESALKLLKASLSYDDYEFLSKRFKIKEDLVVGEKDKLSLADLAKEYGVTAEAVRKRLISVTKESKSILIQFID